MAKISGEKLSSSILQTKDGGCGVGATNRGQLLMSELFTVFNTAIPVFSIEKLVESNATEPKYFIDTLSTLGSTNPADRFSRIKKNRMVNPDLRIIARFLHSRFLMTD